MAIRRFSSRAVLGLLLTFAFGLALPARAEKPKDKPQTDKPKAEKKENKGEFIRVLRDEKDRPIAMQTAIVRYAKKGDESGTYVDLVGAVHIGDTSYYKELNKEFENYDALLYELVAPADTRPKTGGGSSHPVGQLQQGMKNVLELDYQLDRIDYHKKNFVHADMSPDDFSKSMADRGDTFWSMLFRMMGQSMAQQAGNSKAAETELLLALFNPNRALALKRALAQQFEDLDGAMNIFEGPDGSTIITDRNKVALDVLKKELASGKKHLGVFYGAGHLPDMEKHLQDDFGMQRVSTRWLTAWNMADKTKAKSAKKK
jgi:hypothetical protein